MNMKWFEAPPGTYHDLWPQLVYIIIIIIDMDPENSRQVLFARNLPTAQPGPGPTFPCLLGNRPTSLCLWFCQILTAYPSCLFDPRWLRHFGGLTYIYIHKYISIYLSTYLIYFYSSLIYSDFHRYWFLLPCCHLSYFPNLDKDGTLLNQETIGACSFLKPAIIHDRCLFLHVRGDPCSGEAWVPSNGIAFRMALALLFEVTRFPMMLGKPPRLFEPKMPEKPKSKCIWIEYMTIW